MPTGLLTDCDETVAKWQANWFGTPVYSYDRALGLIDSNGKLIGAVLFAGFNGHDVEISYYGRNTMTVGVIRYIARFVLQTFNPARLTAITSKRNRQFMKALQRLGFRLEGVQRCYYGKKDCNRNTGVRFVAFRSDIEHVAKLPEETAQCL
jgi:RimJ/RimL family protein N-acetyltransferase